MRIALVIAGPYPALRGSQVLVQHLATGLEQRGHAVTLVTYGARRGARPGLRPSRLALDLLLTLRLWRIVRRERIDVMHAHNYEAAMAALVVGRLTGRPCVYHGHSAMADELPTYAAAPWARRMLGRAGRLLDTKIPRRADFCIAVSEQLGECLRRAGVAESALACIAPAGAPGEVRAFAATPAGGSEALICYAGNLDGYQNLSFLLDAFVRVRAAVPRARLVLLTHADARAHAARLRRSGIPAGVEIVHARSYDEVRERLARAHVAVLPRTEGSGFPMKLLNYMAAGKAIVASVSSAKGLRDGVTGRVVADGDPGGFAAAVVDLLRDAEQRRRLGMAARAAVDADGAWDDVLDRLDSIYRQVRSGARSRLFPVPVTERTSP